MANLSKLADELKPYMVPWVRRIAISGGGAGGAGEPGGGDMLAHVLASTSALGPFHTVSGLTAGQVLVATGGTTARFAQLLHSQLGGIGANDHHAQSHAHDSADHTGTLAWATVNKTGSSLGDLATRNYSQLNSRTHGITGADHSIGGGDLDVVGNSGGALGLLTPVSNASGGLNKLLRATGGNLRLDSLTSPSLDTAAGSITMAPAGTAVLPTGSILKDLGDYNRKWRSLFAAELYVETLVAQDVLATIGGRIMVAPTTKLIADLSAGATTIDVENNNLTGAYLYMASAPGGVAQVEVMKATAGPTSITGGYRYTVTRNLDGSGANAWVAGDAVVNIGSSVGQGWIDLTSTTTARNHLGPTIAIYARTGTAAWTDVKPVVALGNLRSFVDYGADEYGFALGNDLALTPTTGFSGMTGDRTDGLRLFNTNLRWYTSGAESMRAVATEGIVFSATSAYDVSRSIRYLGTDGSRLAAFFAVAGPTAAGGAYAVMTADNNSASQGAISEVMASNANAAGSAYAYLSVAGRSAFVEVKKAATVSGMRLVAATVAVEGGEFYVPVGAQAQPSITFTGDPNTGIYRYGADQLGITTGGTMRMYVGNAAAYIGVPLTVTSDVNVTGAMAATGAVSGTTGTFSGNLLATGGGVAIAQNAPYYGVNIQAQAGSWTRGLYFRTSADALLGGWGAYGTGDTINWFWVGNAYNDYALRAYPATGNVEVAGTLDVGGAIKRGGVAGGIFVPMAPINMKDVGGTVWSGVSRGTGTYTFDVNTADNGSVPTDAVAVAVMGTFTWTNSNNATYATIQKPSAAYSIVARALGSAIASDVAGVVQLDANGQFTVTIVNATSNTSLLRIVGYYI